MSSSWKWLGLVSNTSISQRHEAKKMGLFWRRPSLMSTPRKHKLSFLWPVSIPVTMLNYARAAALELNDKQLKTNEVRNDPFVSPLILTAELVTYLLFQGGSLEVPKWTGGNKVEKQKTSQFGKTRPEFCSQFATCVVVTVISKRRWP
jgi:hypothetical protein